MSSVVDKKCPKCGQVSALSINVRRSVRSSSGEWLGVCGECRVREAREAAENAKQEAYATSRRKLGFGHLGDKVVERAEQTATRTLLCQGGFHVPQNLSRRGREIQVLKNLKRYWKLVREEIER
jgi:hypothetical protein